MNPATATIRFPLFAVIAIIATLFTGWQAYESMSRLEDPEFTIRTARIVTPYMGASPREVLDEVTEPLEAALQTLGAVESLESNSVAGLSTITVEVRYAESTTRDELSVVWTKLRNTVDDAVSELPPGAGTPHVVDDLGEVFGIYYLITGTDFTMQELESYADQLRRSILLVDGVANVDIIGERDEAIYIEVSRERASALGVSLNEVYDTLAQQNTVSPAGDIVLNGDRLEVQVGGDITSVESISRLIIGASSSGNVTRLGAIANVYRGQSDPVKKIIRYNGEPAIGLGISALRGLNIVALGNEIDNLIIRQEPRRPAGIQLQEFYHQGKVVDGAIMSFAKNVVAALIIVFVTLLVFMGPRSGLIMGFTVLLTMAATLGVMWIIGIPMHRISLGALVISLGMLVDNGVVITDDMQASLKRGVAKLDAARDVARKNMKPLLGGTLVGIIAFAPIGFAPGQTAEFTGSLFWVVLISLSFSWLFAFTLTPLFCYFLFSSEAPQSDGLPRKDPAFVRAYKALIRGALKARWLVIAAAVFALSAAIFNFGSIKSGFFPASTSPQVVVDINLPEGTDIETTRSHMLRIEEYAQSLDGVEAVQTLIGGGTLRYMLIYDAGTDDASVGQLLIKTEDYRLNDDIIESLQTFVDSQVPDGQGKAWKFQLGPGGGAKIEAVFKGPDPEVLRDLADQARAIMAADGDAVLITDDWGRKVPVIQPLYSENKGERVGISRQMVADVLEEALNGRQRGVYRDGDELIPIISRPPTGEVAAGQNLGSIPIISGTTQAAIPLAQVMDGVEINWRDGRLIRIDRVPSITAQCDPRLGVLADDLLSRLRPKIESIELPPGYTLEWEGEFGSSSDAQANLAKTIPLGFIVMVLVVVFLFNRLRQPLIIWSVVPLALVGVVPGLIITGMPLEFMGILGLLSLSGLLIQNSLVLVDSTDELIASGVPRHDALVESAASRLRPVTMGAFTTVLGVLPLYFDAFFQSMTVVLAAGLSFATLITLLVTPSLYAIMFNIKSSERAAPAEEPIS